MKATRDNHTAPAAWGAMAGGALLGALGALVAFAPAHWLATALAHGSAGHVLLDDARGTVWNGSARLLLTGGPGSTDRAALPGRVDWKITLAPSLPRLQMHVPCCAAQPLAVTLTPGVASAQLQLDAAALQLPAAWLNGLGTPFNTLQLGGSLQIRTQGIGITLAQGRLRVDGEAELTVANAVSSLSTLRPLGSYRLQLTGGDTPRMQLSTLDGALRLQGSGQIVGTRLRFDGAASAAPSYEDALGNLLNIIGRRDGGRSIISMS
ncbi:MAG: type II secretion system protein N [Betaproteobacteria bacterium]|jgi:general secretion pathway protein N|nr:type II secretion system protein N [Betaproteobacteria bacterium]